MEAGGAADVEVAVSHLANPDGAASLAGKLAERLADNLAGREIEVAEVAAVLGAHVGPGLVGVVVAPTLRSSPQVGRRHWWPVAARSS